MNIRTLFKTAGLALVLSGIAHASDLTWTDTFEGYPLTKLTSTNPTYTRTFDITSDGFNPLTMTIDSAVASFAFADDGDSDSTYSNYGTEWVDIILSANTTFIDNQEVDGSHPPYGVDPWSTYAWYSDDLSIGLLADLQADGKLKFTVKLLSIGSKDTYLKVAKLVAKGHENPPHNVPDEANTILLTGAAMLGLVALRKRIARRA